MYILLFILGLTLIIAGAHFLVEGASDIAMKSGISPLVIGLTIVAFGTSSPELVVSLTSAIQGNGAIAMGNVEGSNILNILLIGGFTAVLTPLMISRSTLRYEIPLMIVLSLMLVLFASDQVISRLDGMVLLICFTFFAFYNITLARKSKRKEKAPLEVKDSGKHYPIWLSIIFILGGLASLIYGGDILVKSASVMARRMGVSDSVIGLTIVAFGTSLPELATSIVAALKKRYDLAIGNIVGSNILNISFILGVSAVVSPLYVSSIHWISHVFFVGSAILLLLFGLFIGQHEIKRVEGLFMSLLIVLYTYLTFRVGG